jgi:PPOX class F420-dependent enzyme/OxyR family protein
VPDTTFSQKETEYLNSQRLARIATASSREGFIQPDVVPVGFDFDGEYFYVSGMNLLKSTKYKNVQKNPRVTLVVNDLKSVNPWDHIFTRCLPKAMISKPLAGTFRVCTSTCAGLTPSGQTFS